MRGPDWSELHVFTKELLIINLYIYPRKRLLHRWGLEIHVFPAALISQELSDRSQPGSRRSSHSRRRRLHAMTKSQKGPHSQARGRLSDRSSTAIFFLTSTSFELVPSESDKQSRNPTMAIAPPLSQATGYGVVIGLGFLFA